jgi:protein-tyrosine phosphatase
MSTIRLEGLSNFRSLAGLPGADGRCIDGHVILRSDRLNRLTDADWAQLRALGLRTVCDLRGAEERERHPNRYPADGDVDELWLEVKNDLRGNPMYLRLFAEDPTPDGAQRVMQQIYRSFPAAFAGQLPQLFALLHEERVPVLIHCAAGKDRTGFVVALLLHALGVPQDVIVDDYLRSSPPDPHPRAEEMLREFEQLFGLTIDTATLRPLLDVHPDYLGAAFEALDVEYGSVGDYLARHGGLDDAALQRLRERWLR